MPYAFSFPCCIYVFLRRLFIHEAAYGDLSSRDLSTEIEDLKYFFRNDRNPSNPNLNRH